MTKQEIIDYVMHTPYNTNKQILSLMLDELEAEMTGGNIDKIIDKSITEIINGSGAVSDSSFQDCEDLTKADFPEATYIGSYAFNGCTNLTSINFPKVICIGSYAFSETGLTEVNFPSTESIDIYSFFKCDKLQKASFPKLTYIGSSSFGLCPITTLVLSSPQLCELADIGAFAMTSIFEGEGYIYVPKNLIENYKIATNWIAFADKFRAIEDYPEIGG